MKTKNNKSSDDSFDDSLAYLTACEDFWGGMVKFTLALFLAPLAAVYALMFLIVGFITFLLDGVCDYALNHHFSEPLRIWTVWITARNLCWKRKDR
jgi:hypothetical protein